MVGVDVTGLLTGRRSWSSMAERGSYMDRCWRHSVATALGGVLTTAGGSGDGFAGAGASASLYSWWVDPPAQYGERCPRSSQVHRPGCAALRQPTAWDEPMQRWQRLVRGWLRPTLQLLTRRCGGPSNIQSQEKTAHTTTSPKNMASRVPVPRVSSASCLSSRSSVS